MQYSEGISAKSKFNTWGKIPAPAITHPYFSIRHPYLEITHAYSTISGTCVEIIFLHLTLNALWYDTKGCLV